MQLCDVLWSYINRSIHNNYKYSKLTVTWKYEDTLRNYLWFRNVQSVLRHEPRQAMIQATWSWKWFESMIWIGYGSTFLFHQNKSIVTVDVVSPYINSFLLQNDDSERWFPPTSEVVSHFMGEGDPGAIAVPHHRGVPGGSMTHLPLTKVTSLKNKGVSWGGFTWDVWLKTWWNKQKMFFRLILIFFHARV